MPLGDCLEKSPKTVKIKQSGYLSVGRYPIISQEEDFISGYTDDERALIHIPHPVVIFGDHTRVIKYIDFDFAIGADGVKILAPATFLVPKYFYYVLHWLNIPSAGYSRHYKFLKEKSIPVPPREEQERIVRRLDLASEVVEKQKAELSELDALASALFYASFGDPVANPHHIKGENKSFEECLNKSPKIKRKLKQSDYKEEGKYPVISQEQEFISGYTDNEEDVIRVEHPLVIFGDHTRHVKYVDFDFAVGADGVKLLDTKPFINPKFFYYLLKCINIPSAGYSRHYKFLKELTVFIPPLAEQEAFAKKVEAIEAEKARVRASLADSEALLASLLRSSFP